MTSRNAVHVVVNRAEGYQNERNERFAWTFQIKGLQSLSIAYFSDVNSKERLHLQILYTPQVSILLEGPW